MYGWTSQEAVGQPRASCWDSLSIEDVMAPLAAASVWEEEVTHSRGRLRDHCGNPVGISNTGRWQAAGFLQSTPMPRNAGGREQIQAGELRFRQLADSMPQIVGRPVKTDSSNIWTTLARSTGLSVSDHLTEDIHSIIHPDSSPQFLSSWETLFMQSSLMEAEVRLLHGATREYHWFLCRADPVRDSSMNVSSSDLERSLMSAKKNESKQPFVGRVPIKPVRLLDRSRPAGASEEHLDLFSSTRNQVWNRLDAEVTSFIRFISRERRHVCPDHGPNHLHQCRRALSNRSYPFG